MANRTNTTRPHSAPGLYFKDTVETPSSSSTGITTLGVAGETLRGPAFQSISISNWREYQTYFGGTSTAKFKGSQYPKYELPYIAKSYLEQSNQLEVVRVLGLSGVNAGPAWVITATKHKVYTGYDYTMISSEPSGQTWGPNNTYESVDLMPKAPNVSESNPTYIRVVNSYEWHTVCSNCESEKIEKTYDLTDPEKNTVPDANTTDLKYIEVIQSYWYKKLDSEPTPEEGETIEEVAQIPSVPSYDTPKYIKVKVSAEGETEVYEYYDKESIAYCYEKITIYDYYKKEWKSGVQLAEEDFCEGNRNNMVVAVIRSRGQHKKSAFVRTPTEADKANGICDDVYSYDGIEYFAKEMRLEPSKSLVLGSSCNPGFSTTTGDFTIDNYNYGTFTIVVDTIYGETKYYSVSLNPGEKNYIYNVIGGDPEEGDAEVYVEELYDIALRQLIEEGVFNAINSEVIKYPAVNIVPKYADVNDIMTESVLTKRHRGKRYLYSSSDSKGITVYYCEDDGKTWVEGEGLNGVIYTVYERTNANTGKKEYFYGAYTDHIEFTYDIYDGDTTGITWIECSQDVTNEQQNVFTEYPVYFNNPSVKTPEYLKIISKNDFVNVDDVITLDGNKVMDGTKEISESPVAYYPFHIKVTTEHAIDGANAVSIHIDKTFASDDYFEVYSYSDQQMKLYKYNFDNNNTSTNAIDGLEAGTYDFVIYTTVDGEYTISINTKSGETAEDKHVEEVKVTVAKNDGVVYHRGVTNITNSTKAKKQTERLTEYNYKTDVVDGKFTNCVNVLADNVVYINTKNDVYPITLDFNNYREQYRYASTPWIVSEIKGSAENVQLAKLFRFHTISDGTNSSLEIKVSIENIDPSTGKFDVVVRNFNDTDLNINAIERFVGCTLVPGTSDYISLKIGSFDEKYNAVSNYITVEVIENDITKNSIPAGFLGYPMRNYSGMAITTKEYKYELMSPQPTTGVTPVDKTEVPFYPTEDADKYIKVNNLIYELVERKLSTDPKQPYFKFNTDVDDDIKIKKQYFGVSDLTGIDTDVFTYKGVEAYNDVPAGMTPCFHLDARILNGSPIDENGTIQDGELTQIVSVDGMTGYSWVTVNKNLTTSEGIEPRIGSESIMTGTVYEDKKYRKFTVAFYGGWDGWDYYRTYRSNTNDYRSKEYKGYINSTSGYGEMFNVVKNPEAFNFNSTEKAITSDYYAYLAGIRQFDNPNAIAINVLATPGIDYVTTDSW